MSDHDQIVWLRGILIAIGVLVLGYWFGSTRPLPPTYSTQAACVTEHGPICQYGRDGTGRGVWYPDEPECEQVGPMVHC